MIVRCRGVIWVTRNAIKPPFRTPQSVTTNVFIYFQVGTVLLYGIPIVSLFIESQERLCLAQISNTLLKQFSYNEIHNRRVALGITCVQCTPVQLEILRRAGAMPVSSRRCGMITRREAERLCKSFLGDNAPPRLPDDFAFTVHHECAWGCRGSFLPARYNSSRAKCIKCSYCGLFFSPNKFIFHSHRIGPSDKYIQPDAANFNSWRRHMKLSGNPPEEIIHAWEDVKAMFNGGTRKRLIGTSSTSSSSMSPSSPKRFKEIPQLSPPQQQQQPIIHQRSVTPIPIVTQTFPIKPINIHPNQSQRIAADIPLTFSRTFMMDYMWHTQNKTNSFHFPPYALPWLKRPGSLIFNNHEQPAIPSSSSSTTSSSTTTTNTMITSQQTAANNDLDNKRLQFYNHSAFKPVNSSTVTSRNDGYLHERLNNNNSLPSAVKESLSSDDEMVDIETTEDEIIFMKQKKTNIRCLILNDDCDDDDDDEDDDGEDCVNGKQKNWNESMKKVSLFFCYN